jgi:hypothetical protein
MTSTKPELVIRNFLMPRRFTLDAERLR